MKGFFSTFVMCLIVCTIFLFFGGFLIFESFWGPVIIIAFILAVVITSFISLETKIEELNERIKVLEKSNDDKE